MKETVTIQNLKCGGCANTIQNKLLEIDGINTVDINLEKDEVSIEFQESQNMETAKSKLKTLGYPTIDEKNSILDKTRSFVSCASGRWGQNSTIE